MSSNNQVLIKAHNGKFYVFANVQAESWYHYDEKTGVFDEKRVNELSLKSADAVFSNRIEAIDFAHKIEDNDEWGGTEYGVQLERLAKDGAELVFVQ